MSCIGIKGFYGVSMEKLSVLVIVHSDNMV